MNAAAFADLSKRHIAADGTAGDDHVTVDRGNPAAGCIDKAVWSVGKVVTDRALVNRQRSRIGLDSAAGNGRAVAGDGGLGNAQLSEVGDL